MKQVTCTLSRWHKVTERLNAEVSRVGSEIEHDLLTTSVDAYLGPDQIVKLDQMGATALQRLDQHRELLTTVSDIKKMLSRENSKSGISDKLTDLDTLNRQIKFIKNLIAGATANKTEKSALEEVFRRMKSATGLGSMRAVSVQMIDTGDLEKLKAGLAELQAQAYAVGDDISDLNKKKVTLDLDDAIVKIAGL